MPDRVFVEDFAPPQNDGKTKPPDLEVGDVVLVHDRHVPNVGVILELRGEVASVQWTNKQTGTSEVKFEPVACLELAWRPSAEAKFKILDLKQLKELPPQTWIVKNLIPSSSLVMIFGPSGSGKTFLTLDLALSVAVGIPWYGFGVAKGPVLYALGEGLSGMWKRCQAWNLDRVHDLLARAYDSGTFRVVSCVPLLDNQIDLAQFMAEVGRLDPKPCLIVVDTLHRASLGLDENSAKDMGKALEALDTIRRATGATVLVVHHAGKGGNQNGARGSSSLLGAMDTMISVSPEATHLKVTVEKQKDEGRVHVPELVLDVVELGPGPDGVVKSCRLRRQGEFERRASMGEQSKKILALLEKPAHAGGLTQSEARAYLDDMPKSSFFKALNPLLEAGDVIKKGSKYMLAKKEEPKPQPGAEPGGADAPHPPPPNDTGESTGGPPPEGSPG